MLAVDIAGHDALMIGRRHKLFEGGWDLAPSGVSFTRTYAVAPDGEHFLMVRHEPEAIPDCINIVQGWFDELERLCPTGK